MRLCKHLHAVWQGWPFKVLSGKARWPCLLRVPESHVTHDQDSPRHTRLACAWQPVSLSGVSMSTTVQNTSICRGDGACSMLYTILISVSHNHMASHIVENLMLS